MKNKEKLMNLIRGHAILRFIIPPVLRFLNPNYSYCYKCGLPWNWCHEKTVYYAPSGGIFATCKYCWDNSKLEEIKQCYIKAYKMQQKNQLLDYTLEHLLTCVENDYNQTH